MTRFSTRYALIIGLVLALVQLPLIYGRTATRRDECPGNEALLDSSAIDLRADVVTTGERATKIKTGRLTATLAPQSPGEIPMIFTITRLRRRPSNSP